MNLGISFHEKNDRRTVIVFMALSWLCIFCVFRGSIWGDRILAPLDIPAAIFTKFRTIDPSIGTIPRNHYLIDMFDLVLPRQYLAYEGIQAGEFPWWDPYTDGGRPLAVETHATLTDPLRLLLYRFLPFVAAYNWTHILYSFLTGFSAFLLLRFLGFSPFVTLLGALSFQFSGLQAILFYPEFVPNTLWCYPLLWVVLIKYFRTRPALAIGLGGLLCAAAILAGSQQSHAWLALFLGCLFVGYGLADRADLLRLFWTISGAFILGCLISAPVLVPQIEIFALSKRPLGASRLGKHLLTGIFSLSGIFPWVTGSFRSIDLSKIVGQMSVAYLVFTGTPIMILAAAGLAGFKTQKFRRPELFTAICLLATYFVVICSTPLLNVLYTRSAGLAVLGVIVLFGCGFEQLLRRSSTFPGKVVKALTLLLGLAVIAVHLFAFLVYPRIEDKILQKALAIDQNNAALPSVPDLRRFQVKNLPNEITIRNPEVLLAFCGALLIPALLAREERKRDIAALAIFICNLLPLLLFFSRYIPSAPVETWRSLIAGGPEQQKIMSLLGRDGRYIETAPTRIDYAIPGAAACYYKIHSLNGFSAFFLFDPDSEAYRRKANLHYLSTGKTDRGEFVLQDTNQVRFVWEPPQKRGLTIVSESLNTIRLHIEPGAAGHLVRTDTYYPGWRAEKPSGLPQSVNKDGFLTLEIPPNETDLALRFEHSFSTLTKGICIGGLAATLLLFAVSAGTRKSPEVSPAVGPE